MGLTTLANKAIGSPKLIRKLWQSGPDSKPPSWEPAISQQPNGESCLDDPFSILAAAAVEFGESFLALDIAEAGIRILQAHPATGDPAVQESLRKLGHSKALALLRTGAIAAAHDLLQKLYEHNRDDLEIGAALARTYKDLAFLAESVALRKRHFERSHDMYFAAFRATGDVFPGINAAATALWLGRRKTATALADEVSRTCAANLKSHPSDYWLMATLAEAQLILGRTGKALRYYQRARADIDLSHKWANLNSTRKQARRLCDHLSLDFSTYEKVFRFPKVAVFSGHMFDAPHRPVPRFTEAMEPEVRAQLRKRLEQLNIGFGVSSAASGADFLFIEEMLDLGRDVRVVLPWPKEEFIRSSVNIKPGARWLERFHSLLEKVMSVTYLSQQTEPKATRLGYLYVNESLGGLALIGARILETDLVPIAVWDMQPGDGLGGTSGFVSFWQQKLGRDRVEIIPLTSKQNKSSAVLDPVIEDTEALRLTVARGQETIKTMLFADVWGYSKIPEREVETFMTHFLARISALVDRAPQRPIVVNTWGDAIYLVFDDVLEAGQFALLLRDEVEETEWSKEGIQTKLRLRIALHTGPVFLCVDPLVRHMTITGSHVTHAARIEPKVNPGEVWASESFAAQVAIASLERKPPFGMDYLGQIELAKSYGAYALFRLRPPIKSELDFYQRALRIGEEIENPRIISTSRSLEGPQK